MTIQPTHPTPIPQHVGIIVDGNRRWAKMRGISSADGHREGATVVLDSLDWAEEFGISTLTLWLLSTDNVARPASELTELFSTIESLLGEIVERGFGVRVLGSMSMLPESLVHAIRAAEAAEPSRALAVNVGIGYGGRQEIADATRAYVEDALSRGETLESAFEGFSEHSLAPFMYTAGQASPDLIIRTSGEQRLSGFLLWHSVHSELVFADVMWPDFSKRDLAAALNEFASRERRFGA